MVLHRLSGFSKIAILAQFAGILLIAIGSSFSIILYILGFIVLLPGSGISFAIPIQAITSSHAWSAFKLEDSGLEDIIYFTATLIVNGAVILVVHWYRKRRVVVRQNSIRP